MKLSKKVLLSLSFVGIVAGGVAQGMDDILYALHLYDGSYPDLKDDQLLKTCQDALANYSPEKAKALKIKVAEDFSEGVANGYTCSLPFLPPVIALNQEAVNSNTKYTIALHETGHIADPDKGLGRFVLTGLYLVCAEIIGKNIINLSKPSKPFSKEDAKCFLLIGGGVGAHVLCGAASAYLSRKREEFADDFACKYIKNPVDLLNRGKACEMLAAKRDTFDKCYKFVTRGMFDTHPSDESRAKKFFDQYEKRISENLKAKQEGETIDQSIFMGL